MRLRANIYGYIMNRQTYETALSRIKEMETAAQYETFIEDTYHVAKMLSIAIDSKLKYCAYFIKENRNNG